MSSYPDIIRLPQDFPLPMWIFYVSMLGFLILFLTLHHTISPFIILLILFIFLLTLFFPEIPLVAFAFIGTTKPWLEENVAFFQAIDYTVFLAIYVALLVAIRGVQYSGKKLPPFHQFLWLPLGLAVLLIVGLIYTPTFVYGLEKTLRFIVFNILFLVAIVLLMKERKHIIRTISIFIIFAFVFAIYMLVEGYLYFARGELITYIVRMTVLGANPLDSANMFSLAAVMLIVMTYYAKLKTTKTVLIFGTIILLVALLVTNSRGPVLSLILSVFIFYTVFSGMPKSKMALLFLGMVVLFLTLLFTLPDFLVGRYLAFLGFGTSTPLAGGLEALDTAVSRKIMLERSIESAFSSLGNFFFGVGTGGFADYLPLKDFPWYPHNIFFEVLYEVGIFGFLLLAAHFLHITKYTADVWNKEKKYGTDRVLLSILIVATISMFFTVMTTWDIAGIRNLWFFFGLIIAFGRIISTTPNRSKHIK